MNNLLKELQRRNVFRVAMVYAIVGWLLMQVGVVLETSLNLPERFDTFVTVIVLLGFPVALMLAWVFEMTPDGVKPTINSLNSEEITENTSKTLNTILVLLGVLAVTFGVIGWQNLRPSTDVEQTVEYASNVSEEKAEHIKQSIAVLPFEDYSSDKSQDYFARGISEELLNVLARIDGLRVASRTSAFALKDEGKSIDEIAERLKVAHILEGSIRKSGQTLRITAQLIDTSNDEHLWSETFDRPLSAENIFEVQDEIAAAIVKELKGKLTIKPPEASGRTLSLEAYELYLKARENHKLSQPEPLKAAEAGFKKVIALDPQFAPAYSGLADTYLTMRSYSVMESKDAIRLATPNVERALTLDPNLAEALTSAAYLEVIKGTDLDAAVGFSRQAIEANPNYAPAYYRQGQSFGLKGQSALALEAYQNGLTLDPANILWQKSIQGHQARLGDYEGSRATAESIVRNHPDSEAGYSALANLAEYTGDYENAHRYWKEAQARDPSRSRISGSLSYIYAMIDRSDLAHAHALKPREKAYVFLTEGELEKAREHIADMRRPSWTSQIHYFLNDPELAHKYIEESQISIDETDKVSFQLYVFFLAMKAEVYVKVDDAAAAPALASLERFFEGKGPRNFDRMHHLIAGFRLQMAKGDTEAAYEWIDRFHELGVNYHQMEFPLYQHLRSDPEFAARIVLNKELRAHLRDAIEAQLDNAPDNWITMGANEEEIP